MANRLVLRLGHLLTQVAHKLTPMRGLTALSNNIKATVLSALLLSAPIALAQGACYPDGSATTTTSTLNNSTVRVISYANIRVCTEPASGSPCTPLTNIFTSPALSTPLPNPFQADQYGNFHFCVASPSTVHIQISGPQVVTQDIPFVTLGIGGGGGGTSPCGVLYDVQINSPQGTFGCDSTFFTENPNTHQVNDWIFNAAQEVEISDATHSGVADLGSTNETSVHNHFEFGVTDTLSADYGLCPPDTAPPGAGYHWTISSGTPVSPTWRGGGSCYPGEWVSDAEGATIYLAGVDSGTSGTNYLLTSGNLNANSNGCPAALTTGVTANVVPTHSNSSTTPTFQLCGLSSPATIVKNGPSGEIALALNDIVSGVSASTIRLTYNAITTHWAIQNPAVSGSSAVNYEYLYPVFSTNCPLPGAPCSDLISTLFNQSVNTAFMGPLPPTDPRSAVVQDKLCTLGNSPTCTNGGVTISCTTSSAGPSFAHCTYSIDQPIQASDTAYVEFVAVCGLGCSGNNNSMSDTQGNTWTRLENGDGSGSSIPAASYWTHPAAGTDTITVNFDQGGSGYTFSGYFHFVELRGVVTPDGNAFSGAGTSGSPTWQSVTTANNTDTILGDAFYYSGSACSYTPGTNFGLVNVGNGNPSGTAVSMGIETRNTSTSGAYTPSMTTACSSSLGGLFTQAFTQSVYGGPAKPFFRLTRYVDLYANGAGDFPTQAGNTGKCLSASGSDIQPLVWASCGATLAFSDLTSGTNTTAAMVVGAGASLDYTSTGTIDANKVNGGSLPTSKTLIGTNSSGQIVDSSHNAIRECEVVWGGSGTAFALTSGDDAIANQSCLNDLGVTETITAVKCRSDNASNTTTVNPTFGSAGTGTTICSGALTCGSSGAYSSSCTVSNASLTSGSNINPVMGGTLTGTSIHLVVTYTVPN